MTRKTMPILSIFAALLLTGAGGVAYAQDAAATDESITSLPEVQVPEQQVPTIAIAPVEEEPDDPGPHPDLAQDYTPAPAIWLLSDVDTKIYLFGTYHALPPGFAWRSPLLERVLKSVDQLVLESTDAEMGLQKNAERMFEVSLANLGNGKRSISKHLSPENTAKWGTVAELIGVPEEILDQMPPMTAVFAIEGGLTEYADFRGDLGVETILTDIFERTGKPIGSIEDAIAVMTNLMAIDEALWIESIDDDLSQWDGEQLDTLFANSGHFAATSADRDTQVTGISADNEFYSEHMWAKGYGDIDDMAFGEGDLGRQFRRVLLEDRNRAWSVWLDDRLDRPGTILVAVGSAHFGGRDSVLRMLEERGLRAKRIN